MEIREEKEKKVFTYIEEHGMIVPGDNIVVGVSGGADSVCLLMMLLAYARRVPLFLTVAHVNHGLREEAGDDARYVETLCAENRIPFFLTEADVGRAALEERCSEEDAGRRIRYRAFRQAAEKTGGRKVAVAHNSNDNAETMLFHLFRGSGIKGMSGIAPVRMDAGGICILRPILCLEREEVEAYLRERKIAWRTDSTNEKDAYSRNRIRHHILSYAQREVASGAVGNMFRTGELLRETESYLQEQTQEALERCLVQGGCGLGTPWEEAEAFDRPCDRYILDAKTFCGFHEALRSRMLFAVIKQLSPTGKDISAVHIQDALTLFDRQGNRQIVLPFGITARRQYGQVILERAAGADDFAEPYLWQKCPVKVSLTEEIFQRPFLYELGSSEKIEFLALFRKKEQELPQNRYTKWFDYDKIEEHVDIRARSRGDYLTIADRTGNMVHKSLKDYMIGEKIPKQLRDRIPVVAMGNHILWLVGWRISEYFKVDGNTKRVLQVKLIRD